VSVSELHQRAPCISELHQRPPSAIKLDGSGSPLGISRSPPKARRFSSALCLFFSHAAAVCLFASTDPEPRLFLAPLPVFFRLGGDDGFSSGSSSFVSGRCSLSRHCNSRYINDRSSMHAFILFRTFKAGGFDVLAELNAGFLSPS